MLLFMLLDGLRQGRRLKRLLLKRSSERVCGCRSIHRAPAAHQSSMEPAQAIHLCQARRLAPPCPHVGCVEFWCRPSTSTQPPPPPRARGRTAQSWHVRRSLRATVPVLLACATTCFASAKTSSAGLAKNWWTQHPHNPAARLSHTPHSGPGTHKDLRGAVVALASAITARCISSPLATLMSAATRTRRLHSAPALQGLAPFLKPVDSVFDMLHGKKVVLIGEESHGTQEFYANRCEISKRLIAERDFLAVALECDFPEANSLHRFVMGSSAHHEARRCSSQCCVVLDVILSHSSLNHRLLLPQIRIGSNVSARLLHCHRRWRRLSSLSSAGASAKCSWRHCTPTRLLLLLVGRMPAPPASHHQQRGSTGSPVMELQTSAASLISLLPSSQPTVTQLRARPRARPHLARPRPDSPSGCGATSPSSNSSSGSATATPASPRRSAAGSGALISIRFSARWTP